MTTIRGKTDHRWIELPVELCEKLGLHVGDQVAVQASAGGVLIKRPEDVSADEDAWESDQQRIAEAGLKLLSESRETSEFADWEEPNG